MPRNSFLLPHKPAFYSSDDDLLLLPFNTHSYDGVVEQQREMLSGIGDLLIDATLTNVVDDWARLSGLLVLSSRKPTSARIELLRIGLQTFYTHPAALNIVCRAVENCWCPETFDMVLETVADIPTWHEQSTQFFWDFCRMVAKFLTLEDIPALDIAISAAKTDFARRILEIWRDHASGERIGLARLPPPSYISC